MMGLVKEPIFYLLPVIVAVGYGEQVVVNSKKIILYLAWYSRDNESAELENKCNASQNMKCISV